MESVDLLTQEKDFAFAFELLCILFYLTVNRIGPKECKDEVVDMNSNQTKEKR